ncbi:MAG: zinc metalloprotease HtpX [Candidatus Magasanikbacteria bacterium RIFCSPHIGHO2_01_FULL_41_23]|uniref:Protease HtpX homolog n=1 Tax=Candidatus Magasanikbacteria bacterium RIFCSPLOWO2_01_FULL_40_15 TaxID=1798686 RepID=A0A1F6N2K7_9BACT|nr:MAG: zinc metalloprotease HtpX [Candidatus Magasanikbacteria bacterium RIFCSPHIGHO2_01_FULL_41_23]OGH66879.1 MAG: zinc metalloprotease HtpX [Candidatus Magasanikbacteria bacterium RIFCSPHIGHO2_02_FULL_41_35]OGH74863.1 MAG: zinc metalloprotease HtpX [Candidatus Magasanikbacteria bacterium RIFCSPHIGHO2_12_FULL_41_16]OGH78137.1 MAG: zinc metalloprotease HtpX [Candidatus Magasanikbacteria bacterium RIFCSPLOWO2_01_FULL_40_15]
MYSQIDANKHRTIILILIFISFITGLGWVLKTWFGYGSEAIVLAVFISLVMTLFSYYHGDKVALRSTSARHIAKKDNPYLYNLVENLCITAGLPVPKIYIINSPALNAFATGRDPKHSSIAFTTGIIQALENEELEGVIAHELSHVKNYDIRVMTIVIVLVGAISLMANWFLHSNWRRSSDNDNKSGGILAIAGLVLILLSPIIAELIKLAVSRKREFLADASGSLLTRYPEGLARALEKISASNQPLETASTATAHLFISNPFKGKNLTNLFSTHPPIIERIKQLREMV